MHWYLDVLTKNYFNFTGRARRKEYWMFMLFHILITLIIAFILPPLAIFYDLATLIPFIALNVRRLHDTDRSGWWLLLFAIPTIGFLILLVFMVLDGTMGINRFGEDPKGEVSPLVFK